MECDHLMVKNISYLRARDPSIVAFNRPQLSQIKTNLIEEFGEVTQQKREEPEKNSENNIRVYLRIKNGFKFENLYEISANSITSKFPPGSNLLRNVKEGDSMKKIYSFTKIFEPEITQREIFNYVVKPKILDFINGQNSTLLTYGASGSGKTFTLIGTDEEPGIVPRSLEYLFRTLPHLSRTPAAKPIPPTNATLLSESDQRKEKLLCRSLLNASSLVDKAQHARTYMAMQQRLSCEPVAELEDHSDVTISVWVSFAEIYNEQIYDLLQLDPPRGQQRPRLRLGLTNGHAYIKNLTNVSVTSGQEAYEILQHGIHNLNYAPTQLNKHSSRSHSIFTITLVQFSATDGGSYVSTFNFCDLAGSERSKKTRNVGDRLKESNNINSSLLVLGRCISAVRHLQKQNDQKLVPFRESKLTQLFQKALSGAEDIAMIVNISPTLEVFDESQHVLNFAAVAKDIQIERKPDPIYKKKNRFSQLVEEKDDLEDGSVESYKVVIQLLQDELEQQKSDFEATQQMNATYLKDQYDTILRIKDVEAERRMAKLEESLELKFEAKLRNTRLRYERKIEELELKNNVIEIASSGDEEDEEEVEVEEGRDREVQELRETLGEGVDAFRDLQARYELLERENVALTETICKLETELELYRDIAVLRGRSSPDSDQEGEEQTI